jgi:predicted acylesterase/phospholipase RssA
MILNLNEPCKIADVSFIKPMKFVNSRLLELKKKNNNIIYQENMTFKQLYDITKKDIFIIGSNVSKQKQEIFSHYHYPDMNIMDAVAISFTAFPFIKPYIYNNEYYVDGGFTLRYPMEIFYDPQDAFENVFNQQSINIDYSKIQKIPENILGFENFKNYNNVNKISGFKTFINNFMTLTYYNTNLFTKHNYSDRTINIINKNNINLLNFNITNKLLQDLKILGTESYNNLK